MSGIALIRPGLYSIVVEAGAVILQGTQVTYVPQLSGAVDPGGASAALLDLLLLSAGHAPAGLLIGAPCA